MERRCCGGLVRDLCEYRIQVLEMVGSSPCRVTGSAMSHPVFGAEAVGDDATQRTIHAICERGDGDEGRRRARSAVTRGDCRDRPERAAEHVDNTSSLGRHRTGEDYEAANTGAGTEAASLRREGSRPLVSGRPAPHRRRRAGLD